MTEESRYVIKNLCNIVNMPVCICSTDDLIPEAYNNLAEGVSIYTEDPGLVGTMLEMCHGKEAPSIYTELGLFYHCTMRVDDYRFAIMGPITPRLVSRTELHEFYRRHNVPIEMERSVERMDLSRFLMFIALVYSLVFGKRCDSNDILRENHIEPLTKDDLEKEKEIRCQHLDDGEGEFHHSYQEEMLWFASIRRGRVKEAEERLESIVSTSGPLSENPLHHYHNLAITVVTLATRAAIEGGMLPGDAYQLSDVLMNRINRCQDSMQLYKLLKESSNEYARRVEQLQKSMVNRDYVSLCKRYIEEHCFDKLSLAEVADEIGVNKNYLSHLFSEKEHMTIKEFSGRTKVKRAGELLRYSKLSLSDISERLNFNSQSHFGAVFKRYTGITPQQYRKNRQNL